MGIPVVSTTKAFLKPVVDQVVSERYLSLRMKFLFHNWLFWFVLLCFMDFVLATSIDDIAKRKPKNKVVKRLQQSALPVNAIPKKQKKRSLPDDDEISSNSKKQCRTADAIPENQMKQRSTPNDNPLNIDLRKGSIRIFLDSVEPCTNEFKFTYHSSIRYRYKDLKMKNIFIFYNDLRDFLDAFIFINFFKSFAHLFDNEGNWQLCLDVFKEFFEAIQSVNITKYLPYFTFFNSFRNSGGFKYSFTSVTVLLLCNRIVNRLNAEIPKCLKSFFQLILNDPFLLNFPDILRDLINIVWTSQSELHDSCLKPNDESHLKENPILKMNDSATKRKNQKNVLISDYFNLPAVGILIRIMISNISETVSASGITNDSQSNNLKISFYENIKVSFGILSQFYSIKKNLSTAYQMEFNEMITKILLETNPNNSSVISPSSISATYFKPLFQSLEALIDLLGHTIIKSPINIFEDEIVTITERFVTLTEKLHSEHPDICDALIKCLRELKKLFLRYFLAYLGNIYKKVRFEKASNRIKLINDSRETLRKIEFIKRINSTLEMLKNEFDWNLIPSNLCHRTDSIISTLTESNDIDIFNEIFPHNNLYNDPTVPPFDLNGFGDFTNSGMQTIHTESNVTSSIARDTHFSSNPLIIEASITKGLNENVDHSKNEIVEREVLKFTQNVFSRLNIDINVEDVFAEMKEMSNDLIADLFSSKDNVDSLFCRIKTGQYKGINYKNFNFNTSLLEALFQKRRRESLGATNGESIPFTTTNNIPMTAPKPTDYFNSLLLRIASYYILSAHSTKDLSEEHQSILQSLQEITVDEEELKMLFILMKDFVDIQVHLI